MFRQVRLQTTEPTVDKMVPIIITTMIMITTIFFFYICTFFLHADYVLLSVVPLCVADGRRHFDMWLEASPLKGRFGGVEP